MAESAASPGSVQVAANSPQQQQQQTQQTQQPPDISSSQLASPPITGTGTGQYLFYISAIFIMIVQQ
ncbi:putative nuclear hormone receptor HR3 isoform X10 [Vespula squamosa]|uniref:Nuclear hormone receptor HR3 isoform X10 n=1 Tax=Vespula squamosa TaxID=30214 RepID=A0ABD2C138_VESSQ